MSASEQGPTTEDDALRVAAEVRRDGRVARSVLQDELGFTYTRFRRAVELAGRCEWIVPGRSLTPGAVSPPGQFPLELTSGHSGTASASAA